MKDFLIRLGLTEKESTVYLALLEFGTQPASVIAKKTGFPKATVLFLFNHLINQGYLRKSQRGRVQYFYADPADLAQAKQSALEEQTDILKKTIPLLNEFKNPFSAQPKVTFFEGIAGCKKAYSLLLESKTEILEFGTHDDLEEKMGHDFMKNFIKQRSKRKITLKAISQHTPAEAILKKRDQKEFRQTHFYSNDFGTIYSSITVFEDKVLLLNLFQDAFAILIENKQVAETLKTIHRIAWGKNNSKDC